MLAARGGELEALDQPVHAVADRSPATNVRKPARGTCNREAPQNDSRSKRERPQGPISAIQGRPDWNHSSRTNAGHAPPLPSVISLTIVPGHSWHAIRTEVWLGARQAIGTQFSIRGLAAREAVTANEVRWFGRDGDARPPTRQGSARGSTLGGDHDRHTQHQVVAYEQVFLSQSRVAHVLEAVLDARYARCEASRCSRVAHQSARPLDRSTVEGSRSRPSILHRSPAGWQMSQDSVQHLPSAFSLRPVKPRSWD